MHNIQELEEDGGEAAVLAGAVEAGAMVEPVAKSQPLLLNQNAETLHKPIRNIKNPAQLEELQIWKTWENC